MIDRDCDLLRSLHVPGTPLLLPNTWDVASARAVEAAGFPVVATTSGGVAAALGFEDHEHAPADEMLAAAGRIRRGVNVPVTVDAEASYGMDARELIAALNARTPMSKRAPTSCSRSRSGKRTRCECSSPSHRRP
jgi:2-methylisocitrate lyase-like PEP mutase family enzyme